MKIKPTTGSVVGKTDANHWGQVLLSPTLYGVVEINDPEGAARVCGLRVLANVTRGQDSISSLADLVAVLHSGREVSVATLILLAPVGTVVYIAAVGRGAVFLKREEQLATLLQNEGAISGELKSGDTLLLASGGFTEALSYEELTATFDHLPPLEVAEKLTLVLHEKTDVLGSAALIVQATDIEPEDVGVAAEEVTTIAQPVSTRTFPPHHRRLPVRQWLSYLANPKIFKLAITGIILFIFAISIALGIVKQRGKGNAQAVTQAITQAQYALDEGVALLPLNPVKGRERLMEAKAMLEPLVSSVSGKTKEGRQVAALYKNVVDNLTTAMQVTASEPELFFDVSLLKKGGQASSITLNDETLGIADAATNTVYTVTIPSKSGQVVAGGEALGRAANVALHGDNVYTLTDTGIARVSLGSKKVTPDLVVKDKEWGSILSLVSFAGNLYLLDTQKSRIWKYVATLRQGFDGELSRTDSGQAGFSELREYLNPDTLPDLSRATGMAIDGSVWVGTSDGKIIRFTQGKENTFIPKGVAPGFGSFLLVATSDAATNVYVLDRDNKRVVVLDKDGTYVAQYTWQGTIVPSQLVVSEKLKKLLLLADGKIYAITLK